MPEPAPEVWAPIYQVDAFASAPFGGNYAGVCLISCGLGDDTYLNISGEMNLSETAFVEQIDGADYRLRWFTPTTEIVLCGHATLATAHVLFNELKVPHTELSFQTLSGVLKAKRVEEGVQLDFPRDVPKPVEPPKDILDGLRCGDPVEALYGAHNRYLVLVLRDEAAVRSVKPDHSKLLAAKSPFEVKAVCVTAEGEGYDFVSRFFAPWMGIPEDPVTGSVHTVLTPHWGMRLGKTAMKAYQASPRGGELAVSLDGSRVLIAGPSVTVLRGSIRVA